MTDDKVYIAVRVLFSPNGGMRPEALIWEDGSIYPIDRIRSIRPSFSAKAGGQGDRYVITVCGQERALFFEHSRDVGDPETGRWFVERRGDSV